MWNPSLFWICVFWISVSIVLWMFLASLPDLFSRLRDGFDARRRAVDIQTLWPIFKKRAQSLKQAQAAFTLHIYNDKAWTRYFTRKQLEDIATQMK